MLVIFNPTAGRRRSRRLWAVLDVLIAHGVQVHVAETRYAGHARDLAREAARAGYTPVVAAGGDGTVAEVADGLVADRLVADRLVADKLNGNGATLGIIPLGTANVLALELGLPVTPLALANVLAFGRTRPLWPGRLRSADTDRVFVQMVGVGFDAHVVHHVSTRVKRVLGRGAYVAQTLRELPRYGFPPIRVTVDGVEHRAGSVIVSKGSLYGGPYLLAPDAHADAPGFSVVLFEHGGIGPALLAGAALPLNRLGQVPGARHLRGSRIAVDTPAGLPAQADGDPVGRAPLVIEDVPTPLSVLADQPERRWQPVPATATVQRMAAE